MKNEEFPCGVFALRSQILHSSFLILHLINVRDYVPGWHC